MVKHVIMRKIQTWRGRGVRRGLCIGAAAPDVFVWSAVAMSIDRRLVAGRTGHVDVRIVRRIIGDARTNLEHLHIGARAVLQTMPVAISSLETGCVAGVQ